MYVVATKIPPGFNTRLISAVCWEVKEKLNQIQQWLHLKCQLRHWSKITEVSSSDTTILPPYHLITFLSSSLLLRTKWKRQNEIKGIQLWYVLEHNFKDRGFMNVFPPLKRLPSFDYISFSIKHLNLNILSLKNYHMPVKSQNRIITGVAWANRCSGLLTAADGEGQQCKAAPACTASTVLEAKGSLEISALTSSMFLEKNRLHK